jgi:hypothetical protein
MEIVEIQRASGWIAFTIPFQDSPSYPNQINLTRRRRRNINRILGGADGSSVLTEAQSKKMPGEPRRQVGQGASYRRQLSAYYQLTTVAQNSSFHKIIRGKHDGGDYRFPHCV